MAPALARSPPATARRIRLLETCCPPKSTGGTTSTSNPCDVAQPAKGFDVAASAAAKAVIVPDDQLPHRAPLQQDVANELLRRETRQVAVEPHQQHVIQRRERQNLQPLGRRWSGAAARLRDSPPRAGGDRTSPARWRAGRPAARRPISLEHRLMAQVHPVERPDRDGAAVREAGQRGSGAAGQFGRSLASPARPSGEASRPSARATATSSPPASNATTAPLPRCPAAPLSTTALPCATASRAAWSRSTVGRSPRTARAEMTAAGLSWSSGTASSTRSEPMASRRRPVRWAPTPSRSPRSRAMART